MTRLCVGESGIISHRPSWTLRSPDIFEIFITKPSSAFPEYSVLKVELNFGKNGLTANFCFLTSQLISFDVSRIIHSRISGEISFARSQFSIISFIIEAGAIISMPPFEILGVCSRLVSFQTDIIAFPIFSVEISPDVSSAFSKANALDDHKSDKSRGGINFMRRC